MNKRAISIILSVILVFFFSVKFNLQLFVSLLIGIMSFLLINYSINKINKKYNKTSIILSVLFTLIYIICDSIESTYTINIINKYLLLNIISYLTIFYFSIMNLFSYMDKFIKEDKEERKIFIGNKEILSTSKFSFIINFVIIFIINLIFLLKFYPGNLTYDSYNEISQIKGLLPLMNNHSILHTGLLALFVKFGMFIKNISFGVFLYSVFQIIILSLVLSYVMHFLAKEKVSIIFRICTLLLFAFHPINIIYSFSLWKDILFSLCFVIFTILIYYFSKDKNYFINKKNIIIFSITSILLMYLRNNGVYVVIISFFFLCIKYFKRSRRVFPIFLVIISTFFVSKILLFHYLNIGDFETKEMLSIPSQAIARIYKNEKSSLSKKDKELIEKFYTNEIGDVYIPIISDNTKNLLNQKYLSKHKKEYIKLNINLLMKHSKSYIESFISNNYGYYYMNTYYTPIIFQLSDELGIKHSEVINHFFLYLLLVLIGTIVMLIVLWNLKEKKNILLFGLLLPIILCLEKSINNNSIITLLFSVGFYTTIVFITYIYNKKNKINTSYYLPSIVLWITLLFSPVYSEFRYIYPIFLLTPIFVGITLKKIVK